MHIAKVLFKLSLTANENKPFMKYIILLLGAPNDEQGRLSQMAQDRIDCAYNLYANNEHMTFLCTGGYGQHFNTTNRPHAYYAKQALIKKGVREEDFLPFILSTNTVSYTHLTLPTNTYEDFKISKEIIEKELPDMLIVITSDFHIRRAKLLHDRIINYPHTLFLPAKSNLSEKELLSLIEHEQDAIKAIEENRFGNH